MLIYVEQRLRRREGGSGGREGGRKGGRERERRRRRMGGRDLFDI